jgi:hypothetical protein
LKERLAVDETVNQNAFQTCKHPFLISSSRNLKRHPFSNNSKLLRAGMTTINQFDLAFVVDTTGSMGGLINAAQKQMITIVDSLSNSLDVDMQLGVVE